MKEFRVLLLMFFAIVATRMLSEISTCPSVAVPECLDSYIILVPFILSSYFVDSEVSDYILMDSEKKVKPKFLLVIPYLVFVVYVILEFVSSASVVTVEYVVSINILYLTLIYSLIYWLNQHPSVRKLNFIFMVTFMLSLVIFRFV